MFQPDAPKFSISQMHIYVVWEDQLCMLKILSVWMIHKDILCIITEIVQRMTDDENVFKCYVV